MQHLWLRRMSLFTSETIGVPNVAATWARIKVKGASNVFFDLNDNWIKINKVTSPSGLTENNENGLKVYPNPSTGAFTIELPSEMQQAKVEMINSVGSLVYQSEMSDTKIIHTQSIAKGIYFVKVKSTDSKVMVKKVVVE